MAMESSQAPSPFATDEDRWGAVVRHDAAAADAFYYAVRTTGVYCRPSCAARRPRRDNVLFFGATVDAEDAGFRPCRRCHPNETLPAERLAATVARACRLIEDADEPPDLRALSVATGMSRFHFHRVFKAVTGLTPRAYAAAHRANRVRTALGRAATVTEAIYDAGFGSSGRFYATAPRVLGMTPTGFRRGGAGETIRFAVGECSLGSILVAATEKGICAILLGDEPNALVRELEGRFPRATLVGGDGEFELWVARVVGLVEAPRLGLDLPLDIRGTAFQQRVWQALSAVPAGSTASYADIAERLGMPGASRAVGAACAANPLAVAIPCHRVVRQDGALAGYRWGVERKRVLLDREATAG